MVSFLSFIILTLSLLFILLQNGIYFEDISLPNLKIKTLYIKWNEKLHITIKEINIKKEKKNDTKIDFNEINNIFKKLTLFDNWFEHIAIEKIKFNDITASFSYSNGDRGFLIASSPYISLKSTLFFESHLFNIKITEFKDLKRNINLNGDVIFDSHALELTANLNININNDMKLNILATTTPEQLLYKIKSDEYIKSIQYLVDQFGLQDGVRYWLVDAIDMSQATLNSAYGWVDYSDLDNAYKNIYASATLKNLNYTYDPKLDAIHTKTTDIEFKDGVLYIYPKQAYTYGFFLDKSWLKIDFSLPKQELLTLDLKFNALLDKNLLYLLNHYNIKLPFLQNSGKVKTDLQIKVGLRDIDVSAKGNFYTKRANFTYLGLNLDIFNATIQLDNYDVKIDNMLAKYKDIASAFVDVSLDTKHNRGYINFNIKKVDFDKQKLKLNRSTKVSYQISPNKDIIKVNSSSWNFHDKVVKVAALNIPFYLDKLLAKIPSTPIKIPTVGSAYVKGSHSFKTQKLNLDINILDFIYSDIEFMQKSSKFKLTYQNKELSLKLLKKINLNINGIRSTIGESLLSVKNNKLNIKYSSFNINKNVQGVLDATYDISKKGGYINLYNLKMQNSSVGKLFSHKKRIKLNIKSISDTTYINSAQLDTNFVLNNKRWILKINSLKELSNYSPILQNYLIDNGALTVEKEYNTDTINFNANTTYPYKIVVLDNKPIENYKINGTYNTKNEKIAVNINNFIDISIDNMIKVTAKKVGLNIGEIFGFFNNKPKAKSTGKTKKITFSATNSYIYISKERHAIADKIYLEYSKEVTTAQLLYKNGNAGFILDDGIFYLYGKNFNNIFMEKLFASSKFKGGRLDFKISGNTKKSHGVFHIKDTTILKYTILNNILAFVNTIPALVTFSLPGYNKNGLKVSSAYVNFSVDENNHFDINDIALNSKEVTIIGRGEADYNKNSIDLDLNLKTDLGSTLSKIPIVGYIFFDNDTISTSLKVVGKLDNPQVETQLAQDIVVAPLNIIKRTFLLPIHLITGE